MRAEHAVRTLLLLFLCGVLAAPADAQSRQVFGYAGVLGEWELNATVTESTSWWSKEFFGPLTMKHLGICAVDGPEEKTGELRIQLSKWSSHLTATLLIAGLECSYSGALSDAYTGTMACPGKPTVPLRLWLK
jgi:hypothetical protein